MLKIFGGFQPDKIKPMLKMATQRISIHVNKKRISVENEKKEIAKLLSCNKEEKARIKTEHIAREDFNVEAMEIVSLMCDLVHERISYLASERHCPPEMEEAVSTLIWASKRLEIPELQTVRQQLISKYGSQFAAEADDNRRLKVNIRVIHKLSVGPPNSKLVTAYMKDIAKQFKVDWVPVEVMRCLSIIELLLELTFFLLSSLQIEVPSDGAQDIPSPYMTGYSVQMAPASNLSAVYQRRIQVVNG